MELDSVEKDQLMALENIQLNKLKIAQAYNKHVKKKEFKEGDHIQKIIFPIGIRDLMFGKWSPNWECPLIVKQVIPKGTYCLIDVQGQELDKVINGKFLKMYHPSIKEEILRKFWQLATQPQ